MSLLMRKGVGDGRGEADGVGVKPHCRVEVIDMQVDVADAGARRKRDREVFVRGKLTKQRVEVNRLAPGMAATQPVSLDP